MQRTRRCSRALNLRGVPNPAAGRNLPWQDVYVDPKLVALLRSAGATGGRRAITYCQIGLRSSVLYSAARYAGFNASNYVGSWSDWSARGLPSEKSAER